MIHIQWWKGTTDLETISFFLFKKKDRTMGKRLQKKEVAQPSPEFFATE
jgi:hypothetical protein